MNALSYNQILHLVEQAKITSICSIDYNLSPTKLITTIWLCNPSNQIYYTEQIRGNGNEALRQNFYLLFPLGKKGGKRKWWFSGKFGKQVSTENSFKIK
jgi:hypothetical protein